LLLKLRQHPKLCVEHHDNVTSSTVAAAAALNALSAAGKDTAPQHFSCNFIIPAFKCVVFPEQGLNGRLALCCCLVECSLTIASYKRTLLHKESTLFTCVVVPEQGLNRPPYAALLPHCMLFHWLTNISIQTKRLQHT
jgi:hypothetical protein